MITISEVRAVISDELRPFSARITALEVARSRDETHINEMMALIRNGQTEIQARLGQMDKRLDTIADANALEHAKSLEIERALYGDVSRKDAPPSVFETLKRMDEKLDKLAISVRTWDMTRAAAVAVAQNVVLSPQTWGAVATFGGIVVGFVLWLLGVAK